MTASQMCFSKASTHMLRKETIARGQFTRGLAVRIQGSHHHDRRSNVGWESAVLISVSENPSEFKDSDRNEDYKQLQLLSPSN